MSVESFGAILRLPNETLHRGRRLRTIVGPIVGGICPATRQTRASEGARAPQPAPGWNDQLCSTHLARLGGSIRPPSLFLPLSALYRPSPLPARRRGCCWHVRHGYRQTDSGASGGTNANGGRCLKGRELSPSVRPRPPASAPTLSDSFAARQPSNATRTRERRPSFRIPRREERGGEGEWKRKPPVSLSSSSFLLPGM